MNKTELVAAIAAEAGLSKAASEKAVNAFVNAVAGSLKKGDFIMIKGHPCKILEVTTSKTGKHGHAKANITATDIITG